MKLSYRNCKPLEYLDKGIGKYQPIDEADLDFFMNNKMFFRKNFNDSINDFNNEIYYVSKPFELAAEKSKIQLAKLFMDFTDNNDLEIRSTFITKYYTIFIHFLTKKDNDSILLKTMCFQNSNGIPICAQIKNSLIDTEWVSLGTDGISAIQATMQATLFYLFKKYAEVETKTVNKNSVKKDINCKYVNDTKSNVIFLDSKWFTELVNSKDFSVRGHFRLQPKKRNGEWTKELIWINDFVKHGYNRNAGINSII